MSIKNIGVIGAGIMGAGIAQISAQAGYNVVMRDVEDRFVQRGMQAIQGNLDRLVKKAKMTKEEADAVLGRIKGTVKMEDLASCEFVVEAIIENRELKGQLYKELNKVCDPKTIIASNTSSYSVTELAFFSGHPENFVGLHFFNPVPVMQLVEIVRGLVTSDETNEIAKEYVAKIGKTGVQIKDACGFAVNRIFVPMVNEAMFVLQEGIASAEDIDKSMQLALNHPMGPLALLDLMGLDTILAIMETFYANFGDPKYRPCPLLRQKVKAGHLGRKSGQGIYKY